MCNAFISNFRLDFHFAFLPCTGDPFKNCRSSDPQYRGVEYLTGNESIGNEHNLISDFDAFMLSFSNQLRQYFTHINKLDRCSKIIQEMSQNQSKGVIS